MRWLSPPPGARRVMLGTPAGAWHPRAPVPCPTSPAARMPAGLDPSQLRDTSPAIRHRAGWQSGAWPKKKLNYG